MIDDEPDEEVWTPPRSRWFRFVVIVLLAIIALSILATVAGLLLNI